MEIKGRKIFLITRSLKSKTLPAVVSVRGLQRVDVLANFGPSGTQHGMPEEEDEVGSILTSMEEAACPKGRRRRVIAMVVARTLWRRKHSQQWWGTHAQRERERGGRGRRHHPQSTRSEHKVIRMVSIRDSSKLTTNLFH